MQQKTWRWAATQRNWFSSWLRVECAARALFIAQQRRGCLKLKKVITSRELAAYLSIHAQQFKTRLATHKRVNSRRLLCTLYCELAGIFHENAHFENLMSADLTHTPVGSSYFLPSQPPTKSGILTNTYRRERERI